MLQHSSPTHAVLRVNEGTPLLSAEPTTDQHLTAVTPSSIFAQLTFWNVGAILKLGFQRPLEIEDLGPLMGAMQCRTLHDRISARVDEATRNATLNALSLLRLVTIPVASWMVKGGLFLLVGQLLSLIGPLIIAEMIAFVERRNDEEDDDTDLDWLPYRSESYYGYVLASILLANYLTQTVTSHQHHNYAVFAGIAVRSVVMDLIYRKSLRLSSVSRQEFTVGQLVNMMNTDSYKVLEVYFFGHYLWICPLVIVGCLYFLYGVLGNATFVGFAVMVILIPVIGKLTKLVSVVAQSTLEVTDERVKILNEVIQGIRIIKYYAWETSFMESIAQKREQEIRLFRRSGYFKTLNNFLISSVPLFVALSSFLYYTLVDDKELTPGVAFTSLALFNAMRFPLYILPTVLVDFIEAFVSAKRISEFLSCAELSNTLLAPSQADTSSKTQPPHKEESGKNSSTAVSYQLPVNDDSDLQSPEMEDAPDMKPEQSVKSLSNPVVVSINGGDFSWNPEAEPTLRNINLEVRKGEFVMIVGTVGSGKSSLIASLIQEIPQVKGTTERRGTIAYAPQQAWIKNDTVQSNILFGKPFAPQRYRKVIQACALESDLQVLTAGDQTEIGEKGINLSGGQKQRVSLARCVYFDADIVIMDDSLSAVDSHVGRHIFDKCFMSFLRNKTRIFATNQAHFLPYASQIIVLDKGAVIAQGSYEEIVAAGINLEVFTKEETADDADAAHDDPSSTEVTPQGQTKKLEKKPQTKPTGKLIEEEERMTGVVKWDTYKYYLHACSPILFWTTILFYAMKQGADVATDWWLSSWSQESFSLDTTDYVAIYAGISGVSMVFTFLRNLMLVFACLSASRAMHNRMLRRIVGAPVSFFDVTPIGRIINRFSGDISQIDETIPNSIQALLTQFFLLVGVLSVQISVSPFFAAMLLPVMYIYYVVQNYFRPTSRELKRLKNISRSPVFAHFSETLTGASTIRAFNMQNQFVQTFESKNDTSTNTNVYENSVNRWLGVRLETIGALLVSMIAYLIAFQSESIDPGLAGWALTYSLLVTNSLNWLVRSVTECEAHMSSVERVSFYSNIESEAASILDKEPVGPEWPTHGEIRFDDVYVKYRPHLPYVLKGISCAINGGEKIGVCGRTGAGKSSLMTSLFRIVECTSGRIMIDGVNIAHMGLYTLRTKLAIIPQDAVLFTGTVRYNLDPFGLRTDAELWEALEKSQLKVSPSHPFWLPCHLAYLV
eukprot:TRINITY_DN4654_c0_g1_i15.p1 TRINITY_DN4654_c0_g1~~TRINITY_DN4654_c0_g1_i15.p1  ORF type:complete len:1232 (+),score=276.19 TRINITY_DN4654_c0_g1_i15:43-3738(+)